MSATAFQRRQQHQQRKINESEQNETDNAAVTSDTTNAEEEQIEVIIKLSSNPPPPHPSPPVVEMMSHSVVQAQEREQDSFQMDAVTMLSTQIRALSNQIKVHAVLPELSLSKATIPKSVCSHHARGSIRL
jgi:hypothetical protein